MYLQKFMREFRFVPMPEFRVELVERSRYRIPDVLLAEPGWAWTRVYPGVPLAVFEIWSPDDPLAEQTQRFRECCDRGVREILVLEPESFRVWRWRENALIEGPVDGLVLPDRPVLPFSSEEVFAELGAFRGSL